MTYWPSQLFCIFSITDAGKHFNDYFIWWSPGLRFYNKSVGILHLEKFQIKIQNIAHKTKDQKRKRNKFTGEEEKKHTVCSSKQRTEINESAAELYVSLRHLAFKYIYLCIYMYIFKIVLYLISSLTRTNLRSHAETSQAECKARF